MWQDDQPFLALDAFLDKTRASITVGFAIIIALVQAFEISIPTFGLFHKQSLPLVFLLLLLGSYFTRNLLSSLILAATASLFTQPIVGSVTVHGGAVVILFFSLSILTGALGTTKRSLHQLYILGSLASLDLIIIGVLSWLAVPAVSKFSSQHIGFPIPVGPVPLDLVLGITFAIIVLTLTFGVIAKPDIVDDERADTFRLLGLLWLSASMILGLAMVLVPLNKTFTTAIAEDILSTETVQFLEQLFGKGSIALLYGPLTIFWVFIIYDLLVAFSSMFYIRGSAEGTVEEVDAGINSVIFPPVLPIFLVIVMYTSTVRFLAGSHVFFLSEAAWIPLLTEYAIAYFFASLLAFIVVFIFEFIMSRMGE